MAKQLNVNMKFNADSSQAKKELQSLQEQLRKITLISSAKMGDGLAEGIREATRAATELSIHLEKATNVKTGNLDFSKLQQSIKASGKTLEQYGDQLRRLGPEGQQAFMRFTQAVVQSEVPLRRVNNTVKEFATTLANTARWQLSSSVLHGFMGALQSAYGYAQDLNESLNNIRIVTGSSVDDMAKFAQEANKAAKSLSTTTTAYTDASLIYFQQGLSEADVKKRADITIKLANVTRQSAEDVSNQMTAIWNNFYNGSKSLEHYADVLTALGAATASSTDEIAGGLEKFAAIADTIGLSYEYAAAALATLTSNTRESEEVVGTALKTIFARIQGLSLGETLEDGTNLNKYSQALATVGINIQDANGGLKDMDIILDEMGSKWSTLSRAQQTALAQTVAGTRQYNQLMALMANWNNGDNDSFKANLVTAQDADGTLQKQADIYAEGWEAAQKRVTAAAEEMYKKLLNDEFFIYVLNAVEKIIGFVDNLIDRLGGLKGLLFTVSTIVTKLFSDKIAKGMTNAVYNLQMLTEGGRKKVAAQKSAFIQDAANKMAKDASLGNVGYDQKIASTVYTRQLEQQQKLLDNAGKMTEFEKATTQALMDQARQRDDLLLKSAKEVETSKTKRDMASYAIYSRGVEKSRDSHTAYNSAKIAEEMGKVKTTAIQSQELQAALFSQNNQPASAEQIASIFQQLNNKELDIEIINPAQLGVVTRLTRGMENLSVESAEYQTIAYKLTEIMERMSAQTAEGLANLTNASPEEIEAYVQSVQQVEQAEQNRAQVQQEADEANQNVNDSIAQATGAQRTWADTLTAGVQAATAAASALSMLGDITDTLSDPDTSGWEKFTRVLTTVSILIPTLITAWTALKTIINAETIGLIANTAAQIANNVAKSVTKKRAQFKTNKNINKTKDFLKDNDLSYDTNTGKYVSADGKQSYTRAQVKDMTNSPFRKKANFKASIKTAGQSLKSGAKAIGGKVGGAVKAAGPYLAIAAGVAVAAGAVAWGKAQFNKYSQAAEDAAKSAESAATAYQNVAAAYDTFKTNLSNFKDAKEGMKGLVKGTIEYQEAVNKANEAALALIDSNEDLQYTIDSNGMIQIDEQSLQDAQNKQMENIQKAQTAKLLAAQNAKEAQTKSDMVNLARGDLQSSQGTWTSIGNTAAATGAGAGAGALIGAVIGSIVPVIGTAIGASAGAIIGGVAGLVTGIATSVSQGASSEEEQTALQELGEAFRTDKSKIKAMTDDEFKAYLEKSKEEGGLGIEDSGLVDSLVANRKEVEKLASQIAKNTDASYALNKQLVASTLANNQTVQNSQYTEEIVATTAQFMDEDKAKALKDLEDQGFGTKDISWASGKNDKEAQDAFKKYAEAAGIEGATYEKVKGTDKNRQFIYKDKDGVEQEVSLDDMKKVIASQTALGQANERANQITKIYNRVGGGPNGAQNVAKLNAAINNDFSKLDVKAMKGGEVATTASDLGITTDAEAIALGYENIAKLNDALAASADRAKTAWNDVINTHTSSIGAAMDSMSDVAGVSFATLQSYGNMLEKIDETQVSEFNGSMQLLAQSAGTQANELLNLASNIDWSQGQAALDQLNGQLYDMGINVDEATADGPWAKLQETINKMSFSVVNQNIDTLREKLKTINDVAKNIKMGDVISDDDYEKLTSVNGSLKQDFVMTADGYMYVGDKDLKEEAASSTKTQLENAKKNNLRAKSAYEAMSGMTDVSWQNIADDIASDDEISTSINALINDETQSVLGALGKNKDQVREWKNTLTSTTATDEQKAAAKERIKELFAEATQLQNNYEAGLYNDRKAEELAASTMSMDELDAAYAEGSGYISKEVYDNFKRVYDAKLKEVELEEAERYHAINAELETQEQLLSRINTLKDSAFGKKNRIALMEAENQALQDQLNTQSAYVNEISTNLNTDKTALSKYGFAFNGDGSISNFATIEKTQLDAYNTAKKDLALGNITQEEFDNKEKAFNQFKEDTAKYEKTLSTYSNAQNSLLEMNAQYYTKLVTDYTDTLSNASEEVSKYTARMEHQGKLLDHYKNLMSLTGKETDYEALGALLQGQAKLATNNLSISKATSEMYSEEAARLKTLMDSAQKSGNNDLFETYKQQWEAAEEKSREAQDQMLSDLQSWAESEKAILENTLADLGKSLEETLTGGKSFDEVNTQMERAQSLQEEYLTTTNKVYETTKMMRTAQQAIDATSNTVAKNKLKQFITETKNMQDQNKLSQYELDMQQAKYNLLVAEIALEEAQNAKSTVRLQRDSEGNFGYVYTADSNAVAEAQQQFDDAENALYNKGLEGANNYAQKYQQTMAEMTATLQEIQSNYLAGSYESETEYLEARQNAQDYYMQQLQSYTDLYGVATKDNTAIINEAWSSSTGIMSTSMDTVTSAVNAFTSGATTAFQSWQTVVAKVEETTGQDLNSIQANINAVTGASDALATSLTGEGGVISELKTGFADVAEAIKDALSSWSGLTIKVNDDGSIGFDIPEEGAATGGLTSAWGPEGKMLMVHESELILNKDETNEFFKHLNMMESILSTLDLYAASQQVGGILASSTAVSAPSSSLDQNVHIEASFPGVTDRNEIEEALNNLVNKASQYANRQ